MIQLKKEMAGAWASGRKGGATACTQLPGLCCHTVKDFREKPPVAVSHFLARRGTAGQ